MRKRDKKNMVLKLSKTEAKRFLLSKQLLLPSKSLKGKEGIEKVFETLRVVQHDPLKICGRNVDLVLQSRVDNVHPDDYYDWLYQEKKGIECYDKELCIIPIVDLPLCLQMASNARRRNRFNNFLNTQQREIDLLLKRIDKNGPVCSKDLKDSRKVDIFWSEDRWGRAVLDTLWRVGRLVIRKREKGRKYYDLPEKVHGKKFKVAENDDLRPEHVLRRVNAVGLLPKSGAGSGWLGLGNGSTISPIVNNLIEERKLTEIKIKDVKRRHVIDTRDESLLKKAAIKSDLPKQVSFIAPLDNLLWDRETIREIFDFDYRWEVYFPENQRKFGYYVLPILYGEEFIGRIEPVLKNGKTLEIKGLWFEKNFKENLAFKKALVLALEKFKMYLRTKS